MKPFPERMIWENEDNDLAKYRSHRGTVGGEKDEEK